MTNAEFKTIIATCKMFCYYAAVFCNFYVIVDKYARSSVITMISYECL